MSDFLPFDKLKKKLKEQNKRREKIRKAVEMDLLKNKLKEIRDG